MISKQSVLIICSMQGHDDIYFRFTRSPNITVQSGNICDVMDGLYISSVSPTFFSL